MKTYKIVGWAFVLGIPCFVSYFGANLVLRKLTQHPSVDLQPVEYDTRVVTGTGSIDLGYVSFALPVDMDFNIAKNRETPQVKLWEEGGIGAEIMLLQPHVFDFKHLGEAVESRFKNQYENAWEFYGAMMQTGSIKPFDVLRMGPRKSLDEIKKLIGKTIILGSAKCVYWYKRDGLEAYLIVFHDFFNLVVYEPRRKITQGLIIYHPSEIVAYSIVDSILESFEFVSEPDLVEQAARLLSSRSFPSLDSITQQYGAGNGE